MVNKLITLTKEISKNIYKRILKQMLRFVKYTLKQTTDLTELQEIYQEIQESFYTSYTRIKIAQTQQIAISNQSNFLYSTIRLNAITAIKKIKPNLALTLNFNIKNFSRII